MNSSALISVILPVYNAAGYVEESINSILSQTYKNFELIIIDGGSTDTSSEIISRNKDSRIKFVCYRDLGYVERLNMGIELSKGEFIARMDADDVSYPLRFEKQIQFMVNNPKVAIVGTWAKIISGTNKSLRLHRHPSDNLILKFELLWNNPFVHSSMLIRRKCLNEIGNYTTEQNSVFEDFNLWSRMARRFPIANIPEILLDYREVATGISKTTLTYKDKVIKQSINNIQFIFNTDSPAIIDLVNLYHGNLKHLNKNFETKQIIWMLDEIMTVLNRQNIMGNKNLLKGRVDNCKLHLTKKLKHYRKIEPYYGLYLLYCKLKSKFYNIFLQ